MMKMNKVVSGRTAGIATALGGAFSNQLGAASGSLAFPVIGPVGVVAVRQIVAALILLPVVRPRIWSLTRAQWWPVLLLALVFGTMNLTLYLAIERIGLGLAVTLEFCGPLAIALLSFRSRTSVFCALIAGVGVVTITRPQPTTDYLGVALGLIAACSWAAYILLNRTIGSRIPGVQGTATATGVSAVLFLPIGAWILITTRPDAFTILYAVSAGVLASAIPFVVDLISLRRIPTNLFGILMSVNPVLAALVGAVLLEEDLGTIEWVGIALIVTANVAALLLPIRRSRATTAGTEKWFWKPGQ
ncbi:EamA family transporter [Pseudarthrobacter sp. PS3-L1]|uniref:EamA family transporter n=1 Tax=Pseudarthrobacter sp. PS3-L1 TaxID=3046207 RepID=UPI0024BBB67D|nr:EamA family transporter [Pseudarthrobacter sp. PS3-L1]MDJ0319917.1 EamA family transporter [Pseudarthrobacter sp. PS3-L1]